MNSQTQLRHFQHTLTRTDGDAPRVFTAGSAQCAPDNVGLAVVAFQAAIQAVFAGWAQTDAEDPSDRLCGTWTRQNRVVVVPGLATPAHALVFHDGSVLLGERIGQRLRLYPGYLWLHTKTQGHRLGIHMGGTTGPATIQVTRTGGTDSLAITPEDLRAPLFGMPHPADPIAWWAWALRADIDRFHPVFAQITPQAHVPLPGEGLAQRPAYPSFLPRPGLDTAGLEEARAVAGDLATWIATAVAPRLDGGWSLRHVTCRGAKGWSTGWVRGIHARAFTRALPREHLHLFTPPELATRLAQVCTRDLGLHHAAQRTSGYRHRAATPVDHPAPREIPTAHATLAIQTRLGLAEAHHLTAWTALLEGTP